MMPHGLISNSHNSVMCKYVHPLKTHVHINKPTIYVSMSSYEYNVH